MSYLKEYLIRVHRYDIDGEVMTPRGGSINTAFRRYIEACVAWIDSHPDTAWVECCYCFKGDETHPVELPSIEFTMMGKRFVLYLALVEQEQTS